MLCINKISPIVLRISCVSLYNIFINGILVVKNVSRTRDNYMFDTLQKIHIIYLQFIYAQNSFFLVLLCLFLLSETTEG